VSGSPVASVVPIAEEHIEGFTAALDSVARERKYLALVGGSERNAVSKGMGT